MSEKFPEQPVPRMGHLMCEDCGARFDEGEEHECAEIWCDKLDCNKAFWLDEGSVNFCRLSKEKVTLCSPCLFCVHLKREDLYVKKGASDAVEEP